MEHVRSFGCEECGEIMTSNSRLIQHMLSHRGVTIFCCEECEEVFLSESHLDQHILVLHSDAKTYNCEICSRPFISQQSLSQHRSTHEEPENYEEYQSSNSLMQEIQMNEDEFRCGKCHGTFVYKADLARHQKTVRCERFKNKCNMCRAVFFRATSLVQHMMAEHQKDPKDLQSENNQDQSMHLTDRDSDTYNCEIRRKSITSHHSLSEHNTTHKEPKKYERQDSGKEYSSSESTVEHPQSEDNKKGFKCWKCKGTFVWKGDLVRHQKTVRCQKFKNRCSICGALFFRPGHLSHHMKTDHDQECEEMVKSENHLDQQLQINQSSAKTYKCEICARSFTSQNSLSTHRSTHGLVKKYKEDPLRKILIQGLQTHRKKRFKCKRCGGAFGNLYNLEKHQRRSDCYKFKYRCSICGAHFFRAAYRDHHMVTVHQKAPCKSNKVQFTCEKCGGTFSLKKNLVKHQKKIRCQTYKHKCEICGSSFFRDDYLAEHMTIVHYRDTTRT